jgi:hypothetical protein
MRTRILTTALVAAALAAISVPASAQYYYPNPYAYPPQIPVYPPQRPVYPPPEAFYPPPAYPATPRVDRRRVANYCETQVGTCQTPGPMHVGRSCNCFFPGYGKTPGFAAQAGY